MPITAPIGTATSCDDPLNLAVNWIHWLSIVSLRVAVALTFSTISPFFTNAAGTRVCGLTRTARYGLRPLSAHHSQMSRTRYGLADCSDMAKILRSAHRGSRRGLYSMPVGTPRVARITPVRYMKGKVSNRFTIPPRKPSKSRVVAIACNDDAYFLMPRSAEVSASENAGRANRRSAYFIS